MNGMMVGYDMISAEATPQMNNNNKSFNDSSSLSQKPAAAAGHHNAEDLRGGGSHVRPFSGIIMTVHTCCVFHKLLEICIE